MKKIVEKKRCVKATRKDVRVATAEELDEPARERRRVEFAKLCYGCLDDIVEWADHYVKPPIGPLAKRLDAACERMREIADSKFELHLAVSDLVHRSHLFGFPWPKKLPSWLPKRVVKKSELTPRKRTGLVVFEDLAREIRSIAKQSDQDVDSLLISVFSEVAHDAKLKSRVTHKFDRRANRYFWVKDPKDIVMKF